MRPKWLFDTNDKEFRNDAYKDTNKNQTSGYIISLLSAFCVGILFVFMRKAKKAPILSLILSHSIFSLVESTMFLIFYQVKY